MRAWFARHFEHLVEEAIYLVLVEHPIKSVLRAEAIGFHSELAAYGSQAVRADSKRLVPSGKGKERDAKKRAGHEESEGSSLESRISSLIFWIRYFKLKI